MDRVEGPVSYRLPDGAGCLGGCLAGGGGV